MSGRNCDTRDEGGRGLGCLPTAWVGRVVNESAAVDLPGRHDGPRTSRVVCGDEGCQASVRAWVESVTGEASVFVPFDLPELVERSDKPVEWVDSARWGDDDPVDHDGLEASAADDAEAAWERDREEPEW